MIWIKRWWTFCETDPWTQLLRYVTKFMWLKWLENDDKNDDTLKMGFLEYNAISKKMYQYLCRKYGHFG